MAKNKTYFQGIDELVNNPKLDELKQKEFVENLPAESFLEDENKLSESSTSRRDFLKYLGFSTCLLYTSPSPRDRSLSRMPSSA